jgi:probable rRNA maturation factor
MLSEKELNFKNMNMVFYPLDGDQVDYQDWLEYLLESLADFVQSDLKIKTTFHFNVNVCDEETIRKINSEHRSKDSVTDVLSFPLQENLRAGEYDDFMPEIELGDLFVCKQVCERQAQEYELSYLEEFVHLTTHGFLHLCGYDHEISNEEEKLMESLEEKILLKLKEIRGA